MGATKRFKRRPWLDPKIHRPMAEWFEGHIKEWLAWREKGILRKKYLAILVPRLVGKTTIFTQAGLLWLHLHDPEMSTYIGSENNDKAVEILNGIKAVIEGTDLISNFAWLYGSWYDPKRTWKTDQLVHAARKDLQRKDPSFGTWGVESGLTGKHPDVICLDDPTSYEKISTHTNWLTNVNSHIASLAPVPTPDGLIMLVGTRYHDGDHFGHSFETDGIKSVTGMKIPQQHRLLQSDGIWDVYYLQGRDRKGKPVIPTALPEDELKYLERKSSLMYAAQYMNDPASSEHTPLTPKQVEGCMIPQKELPKDLRYTMHCDTAFKSVSQQSRGDDSVVEIWGHSRDQSGDVYFIEGYGSNTWRAEQFAEKIIQLLQRYKRSGKRIFCITDEQTPGGKDGAWELALQSFCHNAGLTLPQFKLLRRGATKKLARLVEAASYWADEHVKIPDMAPGREKLMEQMSKIGSSSHDDWADAGADVFHKDIYRVMHKLAIKDAQEAENVPDRPWDQVLKDSRMKPEDWYLQYAERTGADYSNYV